MLSVYRTLSLRYLSRHRLRVLLIVASIALGVATLVATRALNETMTRAGLNTLNPLADIADLIVSTGDLPISSSLAAELEQIPGVKAARPRIFERALLPGYDDRPVLIVGVDALKEMADHKTGLMSLTLSPHTKEYFLASRLAGKIPVVVGKELYDSLSALDRWWLKAQKGPGAEPVRLSPAGTVEAHGAMAALGGSVLILDLSDAVSLFGLKPGEVNRIDLVLGPGADRDKVRAKVKAVLAGRADVRTPEEQNQTMQSVMSGMQTGFALCGLAALVVGMFLVYNALAVIVAERRHEIGILLSLGATRRQVQLLFAGEAALLGLAGSLLGIPLGIGLAYLGLQPVQEVLKDIFSNIDARQVEVTRDLVGLALAAGIVTAILAALVPAMLASRENPAEAVRHLSPQATWRYHLLQLGASALLMATGIVMILLRAYLPLRLGTYGGLILVLLGALLAAPLVAAVAASCLQPVIRRFFSIEWRLAADNLIRSPARTGLVIAALAAGVSLVTQTAGVIRSNRLALRDWVDESISADLIVTSGRPLGAGAQGRPLPEALGAKIEQLPEVEAALPLRSRKLSYRDTQVVLTAFEAGRTYDLAHRRGLRGGERDLFYALSQQQNTALVSENFAALYRVKVGDLLVLASRQGEAQLRVLGKIDDYFWPRGTIFVNRPDYKRLWGDHEVDGFDTYVRPGAAVPAVQERINRKYGAEHGLLFQTRGELQQYLDNVIERLYGIAYAQQVVVMFVAGLGVITALLISVLQRRREMGLLRAIGASRAQVVYSVLAEAALMGLLGTLIGLAVGVPLQWYVLNVLFLEESGYLFPMLVPWLGVLLIAASAMIIATLAGLGPAMYSVRQRIPEAIAYE
jgi:putative ABC transport system permease protein